MPIKSNTRIYFFRACVALVGLAALATAGSPETRVVAIGDVHGAYDEFVSILQRTHLVDGNAQWIGGSSVLVQVGDVMDRGPKARACLDLLMELERQAEKQNGQVRALLGNHEAMNMMGDLRYVNVEEYQEFATDQSEKVREQAYKDYRLYLASRDRRRGQVTATDDAASQQKWIAEHPLGFFEHRDAYSPRGTYGRWLRKHDAVVQLGEVLFMHGGLDPKLHFRNIQELNDRIRSELATYDSLWQSLSYKKIIWSYMRQEEAIREVQAELSAAQSRGGAEDFQAVSQMRRFLELQDGIVIYKNGPLWYRGYFEEPEEKLNGPLDNMLGRLKARHVVVGHTVPESRRITPVLGYRVFQIDAGMLTFVYHGHPGALEIQNGSFTAYYSDGEQKVLLAPEGGGTSSPNQRGEGLEPR
jgi:hypothetical protein